jgi:hypothetical protein
VDLTAIYAPTLIKEKLFYLNKEIKHIENVNTRRKEVGLETIKEYLADIKN